MKEKLLLLIDANQEVFVGISIEEADAMIAASGEPPKDTQTRRAVNFLIVGFLHSGDPEKEKWAKNTFYELNQGFLGHMVMKHFSTYIPEHYDELYDAGVVGLLKALNKFDPSVSPTASSTSWATPWVIHEMCGAVGASSPEATLMSKIRGAERKAREKFGEDAEISDELISAMTGIPISEAVRARAASKIKAVPTETVVDMAAPGADPFESAEKDELRLVILKVMEESLPRIEQICIELSFGLGVDGVTLTAAEIAEMLNMPKSDVEGHISRAINLLYENSELMDYAKDGGGKKQKQETPHQTPRPTPEAVYDTMIWK